MPDKPDKSSDKRPKNEPEKPSKDSGEVSPSDAIDELELEPISSSLPGERSANSLPEKNTDTKPTDSKIPETKNKPEPPKELDDEIDDLTLDDIDMDGVVTDAPPLDESSDTKPAAGKSGRRMFPNESDVDPLAKRDASPEPESEDDSEPEAADLDKTPDDEPKPVEEDVEPKKSPLATKKIESKGAEDELEDSPRVEEASDAKSDEFDQKELIDSLSPKGPESKKMSALEKLSLAVLAVLVLGLAVFYLPKMLPEASLSGGMVAEPELPLKAESITISKLDARWVDTDGITSQVRRGIEWTPELDISLDGSENGALRIFFLDENGQRRGDTIDIAFANGKFTEVASETIKVYCTNGFASEFGLKDLKAREDAFWSAQILVGPSVKASSSEFSNLIQLQIPFEIVTTR